MGKYVSDTAAGKSVSAWVILDKKGQHVATVKAHYGNSRVLVNVHDDKAGFQNGSASGYGYDKFTAALAGLTIDGHEMTDHCGGQMPRPKFGYFPKDYKPRKGYSLANYGTYMGGKRVDSWYWRDKAKEILGDGAAWEGEGGIYDTARKLEQESADAGLLSAGYSDCYRESGLRYLQALGYRVIQAI